MRRLLWSSLLRQALPLCVSLSAMHLSPSFHSSRSLQIVRWAGAFSSRYLSTSGIKHPSTSWEGCTDAVEATKQPCTGDIAASSARIGSDSSSSPTPPDVQSLAEQIRTLSEEDQRLIQEALSNPASQKSSVMGGAGIGPQGGDMVAAFTCGPCGYRMVKKFSKHAYTKGIVIVECPECRVKHLLADNLGWIDEEARNIEDILREKGEKFIKIGPGSYEAVPT